MLLLDMHITSRLQINKTVTCIPKPSSFAYSSSCDRSVLTFDKQIVTMTTYHCYLCAGGKKGKKKNNSIEIETVKESIGIKYDRWIPHGWKCLTWAPIWFWRLKSPFALYCCVYFQYDLGVYPWEKVGLSEEKVKIRWRKGFAVDVRVSCMTKKTVILMRLNTQAEEK